LLARREKTAAKALSTKALRQRTKILKKKIIITFYLTLFYPAHVQL